MQKSISGFKLISIAFIILRSCDKIVAKLCYSCSGICHLSAQCNCQTGTCEADYCFIEKKPTEVSGIFRLTKGCVKRPARTRPGCDFDHYLDHIQCICQGDFCNDSIFLRFQQSRRNISCKSCPESRPDCSDTCQGQWCHEKINTGGTGCGYGPPSVPYFYQNPEIFRHNSKLCIVMSRGGLVTSSHKYCICNTPLCNSLEDGNGNFIPAYHDTLVDRRSIDQRQFQPNLRSFYECISCDTNAQQTSLTSSCKQNKCIGQFCVYFLQRTVTAQNTLSRVNGNNQQAIIHERQGCLNTSDDTHIQLGCTHKWLNNEEEELYCACKGRHCNKDIPTISASNRSQKINTFSMLLFSSFIGAFLTKLN